VGGQNSLKNLRALHLIKIYQMRPLLARSISLDSTFNRFDCGYRIELVLRNADHLYIPAHNYATLKRLPRFNFPTGWNSAGNDKLIPVQHKFLKAVKTSLLHRNGKSSIVYYRTLKAAAVLQAAALLKNT